VSLAWLFRLMILIDSEKYFSVPLINCALALQLSLLKEFFLKVLTAILWK